MINTVQMNPDGSMSTLEGEEGDASPLSRLSCRIILPKGYTLRSFFRLFDAYPVFIELNAFLPELIRRYRECPAEGCDCGAFDHLEFRKNVEMIGFPGDPRLEIYAVFQGRSKNETVEIKSFDIDLLLDMPVILGSLQHVIFGDRTDRFEFDTVYTLFEFIDSIAWALSFHNAPGQCGIGG